MILDNVRHGMMKLKMHGLGDGGKDGGKVGMKREVGALGLAPDSGPPHIWFLFRTSFSFRMRLVLFRMMGLGLFRIMGLDLFRMRLRFPSLWDVAGDGGWKPVNERSVRSLLASRLDNAGVGPATDQPCCYSVSQVQLQSLMTCVQVRVGGYS